MKVEFRLFGSGSIVEDNREIFIPMGKLSGILYYILLKKVVSRDELAGMFWPMSNNEKARISLRNAIHKIRKNFGEDIILSPNKSILTLNTGIDYYIDVEEFEHDPANKLDLYADEFLKGFFVKDAADFEYWLTELRTYYKELYISNSEKQLEKNFRLKKYKELELDINNIISIDNYNEKAYFYLLSLYKETGRNDKIINEYHNLQKIMNEELGIDPSEDINELYQEAVGIVDKNISSAKKSSNLDYYERSFEFNLIQQNIDEFLNESKGKSILITGESGIGKSALKRKILSKNRNKMNIFETNCYSVEKNFSYSPFIKIISKIDEEFNKRKIKKPMLWLEVMKSPFFDGNDMDKPIRNLLENKEKFNNNLIYNALIVALRILSEKKEILLVVEDIQWADQLSLKLIINLILHKNENVLFLLTKSDEDSRINQFLLTLEELNKLVRVELKRFNRIEVGIIVRKALKNREISEKEIDEIYNLSKGNTFFLKEYITLFKENKMDKVISSKMYNILQEKFSILKEDEKNIIKIMSLFYGIVNVDQLLAIIGGNAFDLMKCLNHLVSINILEEQKEDDKIFISFVHSAYKDYVSEELTNSEKIIIHKEIAKVLEKEYLNNSKDIMGYVRLKYHYTEAKDKVNSLKYEVHILNYYLNFSHELFPNLNDYEISKQVKLFIKNDKAIQWIDDIEKEILLVKNSVQKEEEIRNIEKLFLYCKGRYLIRCGNYNQGVRVMKRVIKMSEEEDDLRLQLMGYKQLVIYGIQINSSKEMLKYIIPGIKIARKLNSNVEMAVLYRLYGVYYLMQGDFQAAENLFLKSIDLFTDNIDIQSNNSISLAADYNYIGEIRTAEGMYEEALEYHIKAIELCEVTETACLSIFYINAGKASFLMGDFNEMKNYLWKAKKITTQFDSYWKNSVLDAFLSLSYYLDKDCDNAIKYLRNAVTEVKTINNPRDIGIVYFIQGLIKATEEKQDYYCESLDSYLNEPAEVYYYQAIKYLDSYRDSAVIDYLKGKII